MNILTISIAVWALITLYLWARPLTIGRNDFSVEIGPFQLHSHGMGMIANYIEYHVAFFGIAYIRRKYIENPHNVVSMYSFKTRKQNLRSRNWL